MTEEFAEHFETADLFLQRFSAQDKRWAPRQSAWYFRGQANADWTLQPAAFRPKAWKKGNASLPDDSHERQMKSEWIIIHGFLCNLEDQGLPMPGDGIFKWKHSLNRWLESMAPQAGKRWPPEEVAPLFALAQHHGLPTRLLDWTERPLVAAYFAARSRLADEHQSSDRIVVYALNFNQAQQIFFDLKDIPLNEDIPPIKFASPHLELVRAPKWGNPRLTAQRGIFTVVVEPNRSGSSPAVFPPLDELLRTRSSMLPESRKPKRSPLLKLTLPATEAEHLLKLLNQEWVNANYLFPGPDGAAKHVRESVAWWGFGNSP